jgi:acyl-CoA synthetase (AMP-forming)/AMP-acid ligase II
VGLTFPPLGRGPVVDRIRRDAFVRSGRAEPAEPGAPHDLRFVDCGKPLPGHEIRIVDAAGTELGDRREGRIEFRGPSATAGYFNNAPATRSLFHGDWLDTGDLGYVAGADLYVTGRVKDMIIRAGRNLHPAELEEAVGNLKGVRKGCVAVFACPDPSGAPSDSSSWPRPERPETTPAPLCAPKSLPPQWICWVWPPTTCLGAAAHGAENLERQNPAGR